MQLTSKNGGLCLVAAALCLIGLAGQLAQAGQGCPFNDDSCQTYCNQQGCTLGYCGHFAWTQCICRKCGDEWNWYDKVHYNPDKQVNQTELDSLKLNGSAPIILTTNQPQQQQARTVPIAVVPLAVVPTAQVAQQLQVDEAKSKPTGKGATLTTLLIPDLSDATKLDLNDIPDENSEKFLDFLAKNHEKLVQATGAASKQPQPQQQAGPADEAEEGEDAGETTDQQAEETVEIQISSSNNQQPGGVSAAGQTTSSSPAPSTQATKRQSADDVDENEDEAGEEQRAPTGGQVTRLLRMAVHERLAEDLSP